MSGLSNALARMGKSLDRLDTALTSWRAKETARRTELEAALSTARHEASTARSGDAATRQLLADSAKQVDAIIGQLHGILSHLNAPAVSAPAHPPAPVPASARATAFKDQGKS